MAQVNTGTIGLEIQLTAQENNVAVDISTQTSLTIKIKKPDGTVMNKSGILHTDGVDGVFKYVSIAGDIDLSGEYFVQGIVILPSGTFPTSIVQFTSEGGL